jgi:hypothetical protein
MIRLTEQDVLRATEAVSFQKMSSRHLTGQLEKLSDVEVAQIRDANSLTNLSEEQIQTADRMGRQLAKLAAASPSIFKPIGKYVKKVFTGGYLKALGGVKPGQVKGKMRKDLQIRKGQKKPLSWMQSTRYHLKTNPGKVVGAFGKGVVAPAAGLYAGAKFLQPNQQEE